MSEIGSGQSNTNREVGAPKTVQVKVVYLPDQTPNVRLESPLMQSGVLTFKNQGHDGFWVMFVLDDETLCGYRYVNSGMQPMYSAKLEDGESTCPQSGEWSKFKVHDCGHRVLTVRNKNGPLPAGKDEERFAFTLRVTKDGDGNGPVLELDPVGTNQNGNIFR